MRPLLLHPMLVPLLLAAPPLATQPGLGAVVVQELAQVAAAAAAACFLSVNADWALSLAVPAAAAEEVRVGLQGAMAAQRPGLPQTPGAHPWQPPWSRLAQALSGASSTRSRG